MIKKLDVYQSTKDKSFVFQHLGLIKNKKDNL